jgi:hypothetical protein
MQCGSSMTLLGKLIYVFDLRQITLAHGAHVRSPYAVTITCWLPCSCRMTTPICRKPLALKQDVEVQLDEHYSVRLTARSYELQLSFSCEGCQMCLSSLHGAILPGADAADSSSSMQHAQQGNSVHAQRNIVDEAAAGGLKSATAAAGSSGGSDVARAAAAAAAAGVETHDLLARARALMAADFSDLVGSDDASSKQSGVVPSCSTCTAAGGVAAGAAAAAEEDDSTQQLLARARALMAANRDS